MSGSYLKNIWKIILRITIPDYQKLLINDHLNEEYILLDDDGHDVESEDSDDDDYVGTENATKEPSR